MIAVVDVRSYLLSSGAREFDIDLNNIFNAISQATPTQ